MTYEKHVGRKLKNWIASGQLYGKLYLGQWFNFVDDNGFGYCQPDALLETKDFVFILECKLTYTDWAWPQLRKLYKPIVEHVFQKPTITIQVCKNMYFVPNNLINCLSEIVDSPKDGCLTWHFLGS